MRIRGGGGGGSSIPGLSSDAKTPGGIAVAGGIAAGDSAAPTVPSIFHLFGFMSLADTPGNNVDDDPTLQVLQAAPLIDNFSASAVLIVRQGTLNGFDYADPTVRITDNTSTTAPALQVNKDGISQFQVDGDGVQIHGKFKTGAAVAHVLGAYSGNAVPIYDESGTLLGYMPLYA